MENPFRKMVQERLGEIVEILKSIKKIYPNINLTEFLSSNVRNVVLDERTVSLLSKEFTIFYNKIEEKIQETYER